MMMRRMASSVLCFEAFIVFFFALVAMKQTSYGAGTVWAVCGPIMILCVLLCGALRSKRGYQIGWLLQLALVASGFVLGGMWIIGPVFAGLWWYALKAGRKIDDDKAAAYAAYDAREAHEAQSASASTVQRG